MSGTEIIKNIEIIKGDQYLETMQNIFIKNTGGLDVNFSHISYDENVNNEYDEKLSSTIAHDGTLLFTVESMYEMFSVLANCDITLNPNNLTEKNNRDIKYIIGDLTIKNSEIYNGQKGFPVFNQYFELPIRVIEEE